MGRKKRFEKTKRISDKIYSINTMDKSAIRKGYIGYSEADDKWYFRKLNGQLIELGSEVTKQIVGNTLGNVVIDEDGINLKGTARNKSKDPTGFVNSSDSALTYNAATRTITISPTGSGFGIFSAGEYKLKEAAESIVFDDIEGMWIIYYDENFVLQKTQTFNPQTMLIGEYALVTMFYWDAVNKEFILHDVQDERHGLMDNNTHANMHYADGLKISGGLALENFDTSEDGTSDACGKFTVESGFIRDEDIKKNTPTIVDAELPIIKMDGAGLWRNGTNVTGFSVECDATTGRMVYNFDTAGTWSTEVVDSGKYVNLHIFTTTSNDENKRVFAVFGQAQYESKSEAIVKQIDEILNLTSNNIAMPEYHSVGTILFHVDDAYTNAIKAVIVKIGGGLDYYDTRQLKANNATIKTNDLVIPVTLSRKVIDDFTFKESDMDVEADTSAGSFIATLPPISTLSRTDRVWVYRKISLDSNTAYINLANINDSQYGAYMHSFKLTKMGDALYIGISDDKKYYAGYMTLPTTLAAPPVVSTLTPSITSDQLTMNGSLDEIAGETSVTAYFRYRQLGGTTWTNSSQTILTANGTYQITETVTEGLDYEVQAVILDVSGTMFVGDIKATTSNYYISVAEAQADGLYRYWDMQETSGTDVTAVEKLGSGEDMAAYNGVTIGSDTINANTIYKRIFGTDDYLEALTTMQLTSKNYTILIQVDAQSTSGDHTIFATGKNMLSVASDGTGIQLEVKGSINTWTGATPTGMVNMFLVSSYNDGYSRLFTATDSSVTQRANKYYVSGNDSSYVRIGRGSNGDSNHQDFEYLDNGSVRSVAIWNRVLSSAEMQDVCNVLDNKGMLIV